jgi:CheY-like chemotaxis protein
VPPPGLLPAARSIGSPVRSVRLAVSHRVRWVATGGDVPRIAVAEDDPHLRQLVGLALSRRGYEVVSFHNGAEALQVVLQGGFDLLISDVKMPKLDGIGLCTGLRAHFDKNQLPIMLTSVLDEEDDILRGYEAGANDYLVKPFRPSVLQAKVAQLLHERPTPNPGAAKPAPPLGPLERFPASFDTYTLLRKIGAGGMGSVYEARRITDGRIVALKLLSAELSDDRTQLARYFREIATLTWIDSPHVVRVVDAGFAVGRYYLTMELVPGKSALGHLREHGRYDVVKALRVGADIARAIDALLGKGLVHRDIKPANIMIVPDGRSVLIDFGLAKSHTEEALTSTSEILGTAEYMAPEVVKGQVPDAVSDLYSLGAALYELVTDERPTPGRTPSEIFQNLLRGWKPPPIHNARPDIPTKVALALEALLDPDPARRPQEPLAVALQFEALLASL